MECIFCRIIAGELPGSFVCRGNSVVAFMDIQPITFGHVLVVPVAHAALIGEVETEVAAEMFNVARQISVAMRSSGLRCEGVSMLLADGPPMQEVPHAHLHVFPRFKGDGFGLRFPDRYSQKPIRDELEKHAQAIRDSLATLRG
jgi:histidine triad (HIT) family protein